MYYKQNNKIQEEKYMYDVSWEKNVLTRREENLANDKLFGKFNKVFVTGRMETELVYDHEFFQERFYRTRVRITRLSGVEDLIPLLVSELLMESLNYPITGKWVEVAGEFRSFNKMGEDGRTHLDLYLFASDIKVFDNEYEMNERSDINIIYLDGFICKPPAFRATPKGRQITDLFVAVNRAAYGKSDYIPCITWGKVAQWTRNLELGNRVEIYGRIQRREYFKRYSPETEEGEYKEAYEVSVQKVVKL